MTVTSPGNRNSKAIPKGSWPCLAGSCNSWLGCSHSQPPFTIPGKNKEKRMAELFCNFLTVVEFSLENFGMDSVHDPGLGPSPVFRSSEGTNTQRWVWHIQGAKLGVRDKPGPEATTTLWVCLSWCPVPSCVLSIPALPLWVYTARVGCCAGLPPHHFSFQSWVSPAGPGAAVQSPDPCASWVSRGPPAFVHSPALPHPVLAGKHSLNLSQHLSASHHPEFLFSFKQATQTLQ